MPVVTQCPVVRGSLSAWLPLVETAQRFAMDSSEPGLRVIGWAVTAAALLLCPDISHADQGGGSFWFPGQFASLAAVPQTPGWALSVTNYHSSVAAAGSAAAARQI